MGNQTIDDIVTSNDPNIKVIEKHQHTYKGINRIVFRNLNCLSAQAIAREIALSEFDKRIK